MGGTSDPIDKDELVLGAVERAHAGIRLVPDAEVQEAAIDRSSDRRDLLHVAPVHADKMHGAVARHRGDGAQRLLQEGAERVVRHLAGGHGEFAVPSALIGVTVDLHIVGRIEKGRIDLLALADHALEKGDIPSVAAPDPVLAADPDVAGPGAWVWSAQPGSLRPPGPAPP